MLTIDDVKLFTRECMELRVALLNEPRLPEFEYQIIKAHVHSMLADLEKRGGPEAPPDGPNLSSPLITLTP